MDTEKHGVGDNIETYDSDLFLEDVESDFECVLCSSIVKNAVILPPPCTCAKLYCLTCIQRLEAKQCPLCRRSVDPTAYIVQDYVNSKIWRKKVRCPNYTSGCKYTCTLGKSGENVNHHLRLCDYRLSVCQECHSHVRLNEIEYHKGTKGCWQTRNSQLLDRVLKLETKITELEQDRDQMSQQLSALMSRVFSLEHPHRRSLYASHSPKSQRLDENHSRAVTPPPSNGLRDSPKKVSTPSRKKSSQSAISLPSVTPLSSSQPNLSASSSYSARAPSPPQPPQLTTSVSAPLSTAPFSSSSIPSQSVVAEEFKMSHPLEQYWRLSLNKRDLYVRFLKKGHLVLKISLDSSGPFSLWACHTCYLVMGPKDYRFSIVDEPVDYGSSINLKNLAERSRFIWTSKFLLKEDHLEISINKHTPIRLDKDGMRYGQIVVDPTDGVKEEG